MRFLLHECVCLRWESGMCTESGMCPLVSMVVLLLLFYSLAWLWENVHMELIICGSSNQLFVMSGLTHILVDGVSPQNKEGKAKSVLLAEDSFLPQSWIFKCVHVLGINKKLRIVCWIKIKAGTLCTTVTKQVPCGSTQTSCDGNSHTLLFDPVL